MLRSVIVCGIVVACCELVADDDFPTPVNTQAAGEHPPSPREMLDLFELPEGFKVTLFAGEPDVQQPIAFDFDDFGRIWVAENYSYSAHGKVDDVLRDRVIILHDKDGDGEHDERKVFWDKGRMLTGLTWGYGGLWILNDGTLSFIPDKNGDDVPDSEPVPLLNGWTKEAGHNMVNGLLWGPDGWLYGRHGILDTSYPGTIDTPKEEREPINCGIWRFHPVKHTFEVVCHGTTNPWGLDYNEVGDMFMSNNVIGHLWHVIPGAHYQRMFGQDFNPHCYELMGPISDHYHWDDTGSWTKSRDGAADHLGGGHSHCGLMLYYGQNFPKEYWGKAFMCNTHGRCVNVDRIERKGCSYVAKHEPNFLKVNTPWFRGVELKYGPAGCVYLSDWSDNGECHDHDGVHRTSGRIYRISYGEVTRTRGVDAMRLWDCLAHSQQSRSEWYRRRSQRNFCESFRNAEEGEKAAVALAAGVPLTGFEKGAGLSAHRTLQTLGAVDAMDTADICRVLLAPDPKVRALVVRLASSDEGLWRTCWPVVSAWLIQQESDLQVWREVAIAMQRFPLCRLPARTKLPDLNVDLGYLMRLRRANQTLFFRQLTEMSARCDILKKLTWYGIEHQFDVFGAETFLEVVEEPTLRKYIARRHMDAWTPTDEFPRPLVTALTSAFPRVRRPPPEQVKAIVDPLLEGIHAGLSGHRLQWKPLHWPYVEDRMSSFSDEETQQKLRDISVLFRDQEATGKLLDRVKTRTTSHISRKRGITTLSQMGDATFIPVLLTLLDDRDVRADVCEALAAFDDDPRIPQELLKRWNSLRHGAQEAATDTLCSRRSYAVEFTKAIDDGRVDAGILTAAQVRQLNTFDDASVTAIVNQHWGVINDSPEAKTAAIANWKEKLTDDVISQANLSNGAALYKKSCATCHKLYGEGGKIGPDLTGGNRANLDYLLSNVIHPSGEVPKQYTVSVIALKSGRLVNGVVVGETEQVLSVQTDKQLITVAKADIEERTRTNKSLMPDGLLESLQEQQVVDLLAFVMQRRSAGR